MAAAERKSLLPRNNAEYTSYPESSLFDLDSVPLNLIPGPDVREAYGNKDRFNELNDEANAAPPDRRGHLPSIIPRIFELGYDDIDQHDATFPSYRPPPELPQLDGDDIRFIKRIAHNFDGSDVFLVEFQAKEWLLKIVSC